MKKRFSFIMAVAMLILVAAPVQASPNADTTVFSVERNESVTMVLEKFPSNETYYVFMGKYGTYAMNGELVSKLTTNDGGTFLAKFNIPDHLRGESSIAIRFQSISGESVWWNYFYNDTTEYNPYAYYGKDYDGNYYYGDYGDWDHRRSDDDVTYNNLENGFPTFTVTAVNAGASITVQTVNFPSDVRWAVYMKDGAMDADDWIEITGFTSDGGTQTLTLTIPSDLQYVDNIAVKFYCMDYVLGTNDFVTYDLVANRDYP